MKTIQPDEPTLTPPSPEHAPGGDLQQLQGQIKLLQELVYQNHEQLASIRRQMRIATVFGFLRLLIIVVPLIIAAIYLPPFVREAINYYSQFTQISAGPGNTKLQVTDLQDLLQSAGLFQQ